jgi:pimeloyl-ACP methyl ester carboxylesterase
VIKHSSWLFQIALLFSVITAIPVSAAKSNQYPPWHPFKSEKHKQKYFEFYKNKEKEWPVPYESKMVPTSFGQTYVRICGRVDGPPLVLLPGGGNSSLGWMPFVRKPAEHYRVYLIDKINDVGLSVNSRPVKSTDDITEWLDELFTALSLTNDINIMGGSYGGWIASQYALKHPERIGKIVLASPAATVGVINPELYIRGLLGLVNNRLALDFSIWLAGDWALDKDKEKLKILEKDILETRMEWKSFKSHPMVNPTVLTDEELQHLKMPVLFIDGEKNHVTSVPKAVARLQMVVPHYTIEIIPGAGHMFMGQYGDEFMTRVLVFLAKT